MVYLICERLEQALRWVNEHPAYDPDQITVETAGNGREGRRYTTWDEVYLLAPTEPQIEAFRRQLAAMHPESYPYIYSMTGRS